MKNPKHTKNMLNQKNYISYNEIVNEIEILFGNYELTTPIQAVLLWLFMSSE